MLRALLSLAILTLTRGEGAPSFAGREVGLCLFIHSYGDRAGWGRLENDMVSLDVNIEQP